MLEQLGAVVGVVFIFAKVVGVIKSILWAEETVGPLVKKKLINERAEYLRAHVYEEHADKPQYCRQNQCSAF